MSESVQLNLLLHAQTLPAEGMDPLPFSLKAGIAPFPALEVARWLMEQCGESPVRFFIDATGSITADTDEPLVELDHLIVEAAPLAPQPVSFAFSSAFTRVDIEESFRYLPQTRRYAGEDIPEEEIVRDLLNKIRGVLSDSARAFTTGATLPLLRWTAGDEPGTGRADLVGLWLLDPAQEALLREWSSDSGDIYATSGLVLEKADVEGRGLKEVVASLALLGVVFGSSVSQAEAASPNKPVATATAKANGSSQAEKKPGFFARVFGKKEKKESTRRQGDPVYHWEILKKATKENTQVVVEIGKQRAYVVVDNQIALDTPISTGRTPKATPRGTFKITQRVKTGKISTIYKCPLPFWMRLDEKAVGMHVGDLPGYPASHGCIRLHKEAAPVVFEHTFSGTQVHVVDTWVQTPAGADAATLASN